MSTSPPGPLDGPAPGAPGLEPRWTSSAKSGVGSSADARSRIWFALGYGIVDEVYYPRVDRANTRDCGLLVTDAGPTGRGDFFSEEKRDTDSVVTLLAPGVPGYRLVNTCRDGRYRIIKTVVADPERSVLVQHVRFEPLTGALSDYRVFVLCAPHIANQGSGNDAWTGDYKGVPMLFAARGETALALACAPQWSAMSVGYVGASDGWGEVRAHGKLLKRWSEARNGNVAITGEVDLDAARSGEPADVDAPAEAADFTIALGFGRTGAEAGQAARLTLLSPFERVERAFVDGWRRFHAVAARTGHEGELGARHLSDGAHALYHLSIGIIALHEDKRAQGAMIASLSIPWGETRGDHEMGGYHLVWPRDLVESAGAMVAAGQLPRARRTLRYLMSTQEAEGYWAQNMWLDGTPYWQGVQLDETALPILLADALRRGDALEGLDPWPMVRRAVSYLLRNGPATQQDRWEEDGGYSPFTLSAEVAALLAAADFGDIAGHAEAAAYVREAADAWNEDIERWAYVRGSSLAARMGVDGYYARIAPRDVGTDGSDGLVPVKNRPMGASSVRYTDLVSPDALALVRFGLRAPDDPRIVDTVRVIDALLKVETATGPGWHRYNGDGYGEHEDGAPFDGTGIGRVWPLLAGERAHYELAAGRTDRAVELLETMYHQASDGGMLPEQIWDAADRPRYGRINGRPTGSAMPLVWAHAEYVKLVRSLADGRITDCPPQTVMRYLGERHRATHAFWSEANRIPVMRAGRTLRIQTAGPARVHWSADGWRSKTDTDAAEVTRLGVWAADLPTTELPVGATVLFTLYWPVEDRWEGRDYSVEVVDSA